MLLAVASTSPPAPPSHLRASPPPVPPPSHLRGEKGELEGEGSATPQLEGINEPAENVGATKPPMYSSAAGEPVSFFPPKLCAPLNDAAVKGATFRSEGTKGGYFEALAADTGSTLL